MNFFKKIFGQKVNESKPRENSKEDLFYCLYHAVKSAQLGHDMVPTGFHPLGNGGVIQERRHSLTWMLSKETDWDATDLST